MKPLSKRTVTIAIEAIKDDIKRSRKVLSGWLSNHQSDIYERSIRKQQEAIKELRRQ